jgi:hypothetical protein
VERLLGISSVWQKSPVEVQHPQEAAELVLEDEQSCRCVTRSSSGREPSADTF